MRKGLLYSRFKEVNFPFDLDSFSENSEKQENKRKEEKKMKEREKEEKYEKYECRVCGNIIKADPLNVPRLCRGKNEKGCNALYSFRRISFKQRVLR